MTTITRLHSINPDARERLMERIPEAPEDFDRAAMIDDLPMILETALDLILDEIEALPGQSHSGAIGCRILATAIDRLRV